MNGTCNLHAHCRACTPPQSTRDITQIYLSDRAFHGVARPAADLLRTAGTLHTIRQAAQSHTPLGLLTPPVRPLADSTGCRAIRRRVGAAAARRAIVSLADLDLQQPADRARSRVGETSARTRRTHPSNRTAQLLHARGQLVPSRAAAATAAAAHGVGVGEAAAFGVCVARTARQACGRSGTFPTACAAP
jgi:hypothetical protein